MSTVVAEEPRVVDWQAFAAALGPIPHSLEPPLVKQKSRDFYWYSPILKAQLKGRFGDIVVNPRTEDDVRAVAQLCVDWRVPLTVRGAGTGNYGQAMPLQGGVILEMTGLDRILSLDNGVLSVQAGKKLADLEAATLPRGWEMRFHPSTRRTATIGGFVAGGSTGVGAINYGLLRDRGNVLGLRVVTLENPPRILDLRGDDVLKATHAYGCNGVITRVDLPLAPAQPWADVIADFPDLASAMRFAQDLCRSDPIAKKLVTVIAAPVPQQYFRPLQDVIPADRSVVLCMIAESALEPFDLLVSDHGGHVCYRKAGEGLAETTPLYEFTWNHTTLQALKVDKSITYLQTFFPPGDHVETVLRMAAHFGDEVPMHLEFVRLNGEIACFGLQLVRYTTPERLQAIMDYHEAQGCPVFNPHTYILEDGGMKEIDAVQLAFKREADPQGLLNPGKMRAWWEQG